MPGSGESTGRSIAQTCVFGPGGQRLVSERDYSPIRVARTLLGPHWLQRMPSYPYLSHDDRVRKLEDELYITRWALVSLLSEELQEIIESYRDCQDWSDQARWERRVVEHVLGMAWVPKERMEWEERRAYCPLCRHGSSSPYAEGFIFPGGLQRHLTGESNAAQCRPLRAVFQLAQDYLYPKFREADEKRDAERRQILDERKKVEPLFTVGPDDNRLLDEDASIEGGEHVRNEASLAWAIARLSDLGFTEQQTGNARAFMRPMDSFVVYADPRRLGVISFTIYREADAKPRKLRRVPPRARGWFSLKDAWRNDLGKKFDAALIAALPKRGARRQGG